MVMSECLLVVGAMASRFIGEGWLEGVCLSVFLGCVCTALGKALLGVVLVDVCVLWLWGSVWCW